MKSNHIGAASAIVLLTALAGASAPVYANHAAAREAKEVISLKDGSTLYIFRDGKMAKEDKYGREARLKSGEVLEATDGRKVSANGNETARLHGLLNYEHGGGGN